MDDYEAVVEHAVDVRDDEARWMGDDVRIVWMGHSLGASIAACLLDRLVARRQTGDPESKRDLLPDGLIYENGFASIPRMVSALYPQRWLPYHYLGGLAWDRWEAVEAIARVAQSREGALEGRKIPALFLSSSQDELVPPEMVREAFEATTTKKDDGGGGESALEAHLVSIPGALHDFGFKKQIWSTEIVSFLRQVAAVDRSKAGRDR